ncbi:MAG: hypothetical protein U0X39_15660 [Bacteroidales bacterium]
MDSIQKLNKNINTRTNWSHAASRLMATSFTSPSNRDGGSGGLDIYVSTKDAAGEWGEAVNLGKTINSAFNEETPFISKNDSILFFSSEGHNSMGGYDVYKSVRSGDDWKTPENIGFPVSSTDDDRFYEPFNNGINAYYSMSTEYKKRDIYYLGFGAAAIDVVFEIKGTVALDDSIQKPDKRFLVYLVSKTKGDTLQTSFPARETGEYSFSVNPDDFKVIFTGPDYLTQVRDTLLKPDDIATTIGFDGAKEKIQQSFTTR